MRYIMSAFIPRRQAKRMVKASRENKQFGAVLSQGRTVFNYANLTLGEEAMSHTLHSRVKIRFPKGFWQECSRLCFKRSCTYSFRNSLRRSLHLYMRSLRAGAKTSCGMLRGKKPEQRKSNPECNGRLKCPELGQLLYDWFIDTLHFHKARVNSFLFLDQAQHLKERLRLRGVPPESLPNLDGNAGKSWLRRWRKRFSVVIRATVKHIKVSRKKLRARVQVYLKKVVCFRRSFGEAKAMRWVSWNEKPAWFNNTALDDTYSTRGYEPLVKAIEAHSRQRFTICTCVDSAAMSHTDEPPPVGAVWRELTADQLIPEWMHVQTQCKSSYRARDMVELLEKTLSHR